MGLDLNKIIMESIDAALSEQKVDVDARTAKELLGGYGDKAPQDQAGEDLKDKAAEAAKAAKEKVKDVAKSAKEAIAQHPYASGAAGAALAAGLGALALRKYLKKKAANKKK